MFDIFISYKNDPIGILISNKIASDLKNIGYSVYHNSDDNHRGEFDKRLFSEIEQCHDFLLIVSNGCLEQLLRNETVDWVRSELLHARQNNKNIIPVLVNGVLFPKNAEEMPEKLRFLPILESVMLPLEYQVLPPFQRLLGKLISQPGNSSEYRDVYNSNPDYNVDEDFQKTVHKAEAGDVEAMYEAALYCKYGFCGQPYNAKGAIGWLRRIIEQNDNALRAKAYSMMSIYYYNGDVPGEEQSYEKSFQLKKMASEYSQQAQMATLSLMRKGIGCHYSFSEIKEAFEKIHQADPVAIDSQATFYIDSGRIDLAVELLSSVNNLTANSAYRLAKIYYSGSHKTPPSPDCFRAAEYYRYAVQHGNTDAAYELGLLYNCPPLGKFIKDDAQAYHYMKIAAEAGNSRGQLYLGIFYQKGWGCEVNISESIKWEEKAASQGELEAAYQLMFLYQIEGFINYEKAFYYAKLASQGLVGAMFCTGVFYLVGRGCKYNLSEAKKYFSLAKKYGSDDAEIMLNKIRIIEK